LGALPKSGLESGLMDIAKIMSPHHRQGAPLGQREKRKCNCSFHHYPFINSCKRHSSIHIYHCLVHLGKHGAAAAHRFLALWPIGESPELGVRLGASPKLTPDQV
jgi:hypothetical protein